MEGKFGSVTFDLKKFTTRTLLFNDTIALAILFIYLFLWMIFFSFICAFIKYLKLLWVRFIWRIVGGIC